MREWTTLDWEIRKYSNELRCGMHNVKYTKYPKFEDRAEECTSLRDLISFDGCMAVLQNSILQTPAKWESFIKVVKDTMSTHLSDSMSKEEVLAATAKDIKEDFEASMDLPCSIRYAITKAVFEYKRVEDYLEDSRKFSAPNSTYLGLTNKLDELYNLECFRGIWQKVPNEIMVLAFVSRYLEAIQSSTLEQFPLDMDLSIPGSGVSILDSEVSDVVSPLWHWAICCGFIFRLQGMDKAYNVVYDGSNLQDIRDKVNQLNLGELPKSKEGISACLRASKIWLQFRERCIQAAEVGKVIKTSKVAVNDRTGMITDVTEVTKIIAPAGPSTQPTPSIIVITGKQASKSKII